MPASQMCLPCSSGPRDQQHLTLRPTHCVRVSTRPPKRQLHRASPVPNLHRNCTLCHHTRTAYTKTPEVSTLIDWLITMTC